MIQVQNLTKKYGKVSACDDISLTISGGEYAVLLGPNGAGKSTLIKSMCGLLRFSGSVSICGHANTSTEAKRLIGYVPEFPALYPMLTVKEHLEFIARAYKLENWSGYADELLQRFELDDKQKKLGKELSKGMQQKVSICCAMLPEPKVVIFDEPLVGLDPHGIRELKNAVLDLRGKGCAVMVSTHIIDSVEDDWDATYIMRRGKIARECRRADLSCDASLENIYFSIIEGESEREDENEVPAE